MIDRAGFDGLIGDLGVAVFLSTLGGRLLHCNDAAADLLGYASPAALLAQVNDIATQIHVDAAPRCARIDLLLSDKRVPPFIARLRRRDGGVFWGSETMRLKGRRATGEIFVLSTITDVTPVVEAEQRAASSEALLRDGVDSMDQGFLLWDRDDRLVMWNDRATQIMPHAIAPDCLGRTFAECFRNAVRNAFPDRDGGRVEAMLRERQDIRARSGTHCLELRDGRVIEIVDRHASNGGAITLYRDVTQERRTLQRIAESEARFRDGIESMHNGFVLWDRGMRLVAWNQRLLEIMPHLAGLLVAGRSEEEIYWAALERNRPGASAELRERLRRKRLEATARGGVDEFELAGGRTVEVTDRPTSEGGRVSIYRDVTEFRRNERRLRQADAEFRDAIESMDQGLVVWGPDDRAVVWNERVKEILPHVARILHVGIGFHEAYRRSAKWAYPRMTDAEVERVLQRRLDDRQRQQSSQLLPPDGRIVEALDRRTSSGGYITIYRDVTDARRMIAALSTSEERFRDFAETTADWFWEQDAALRFTFVSESSMALTGLPPAAHYGRTLRETAPLGVTEDEWREHEEALERRERFAEFRIERIDPRGRRRHLCLTGKPFFDSIGAFQGYRGSGKDVTAIVETERALDEALRKASLRVRDE